MVFDFCMFIVLQAFSPPDVLVFGLIYSIENSGWKRLIQNPALVLLSYYNGHSHMFFNSQSLQGGGGYHPDRKKGSTIVVSKDEICCPLTHGH